MTMAGGILSKVSGVNGGVNVCTIGADCWLRVKFLTFMFGIYCFALRYLFWERCRGALMFRCVCMRLQTKALKIIVNLINLLKFTHNATFEHLHASIKKMNDYIC